MRLQSDKNRPGSGDRTDTEKIRAYHDLIGGDLKSSLVPQDKGQLSIVGLMLLFSRIFPDG